MLIEDEVKYSEILNKLTLFSCENKLTPIDVVGLCVGWLAYAQVIQHPGEKYSGPKIYDGIEEQLDIMEEHARKNIGSKIFDFLKNREKGTENVG